VLAPSWPAAVADSLLLAVAVDQSSGVLQSVESLQGQAVKTLRHRSFLVVRSECWPEDGDRAALKNAIVIPTLISAGESAPAPLMPSRPSATSPLR
jgi:hypothetical protein